MAARFRVEWTETATADLAGIIEFVAKDSPVNAVKLLKRFRERTATLSRFPNRGRVAPELREFRISSYRELSVFPYRVFYRIEKSQVFVQAVLDGRRDLRQVLSERLLRGE